MISVVCRHCGAPHTGTFDQGRVKCATCERWYRVEQPRGAGVLLIPPKPAPPPMRRRLEQPTHELPAGMVGMGFKLIEYDDGTMFAVSPQWGCTDRQTELEPLIAQARQLVKFIGFVNKKRQEERGDG